MSSAKGFSVLCFGAVVTETGNEKMYASALRCEAVEEPQVVSIGGRSGRFNTYFLGGWRSPTFFF